MDQNYDLLQPTDEAIETTDLIRLPLEELYDKWAPLVVFELDPQGLLGYPSQGVNAFTADPFGTGSVSVIKPDEETARGLAKGRLFDYIPKESLSQEARELVGEFFSRHRLTLPSMD